MASILVPVDFTTDSELAFQIACSIARDQTQGVIVLHVVNPECLSEGERDGDEVRRESALFQSCWSQFDRLQAFADGVPLSFQLKVGSAIDVIVDTAERENVALIVIAAHRHCHLHRMMHGSISNSLASRAKRPIVCVNPSAFRQELHSNPSGSRKQPRSEPLLWPRQYQ